MDMKGLMLNGFLLQRHIGLEKSILNIFYSGKFFFILKRLMLDNFYFGKVW